MILAIIAGYLAVLAAIGFACRRRNRTLEDFLIGGRTLGPWVTAVSAEASDMSAWLLVGLPATAYAAGFSILWAAIGCACGTLFNWVVIAPRLRAVAGRAGALTVPDVLEARLGGGRLPVLRLTATAGLLVFYASYIAAQFVAAGTVAEVTLQDVSAPWGKITYETGLIAGAAVILLYTTLGGFLAVAYTDLLQGILMVATVTVVPAIAVARAGGIDAVLSAFAQARGAAGLGVTEGKDGLAFAIGVLGGGLSWGLGYPGQPHILARFLAIRDPRALRRSFLISMIWVLLALYGAIFVGICAVSIIGPGLSDTNQVMPAMARALLPPWLVGIVIAAALAAMMSTVDSQIMVAVSAVVHDVMVRMSGKRPSDRTCVAIGRAVTLALGVAGVVLALGRKNVFEQVFDAWSGLGAGLGPPLILTLLWRRTTRGAAAAGMAIGFGTVLAWRPIARWVDSPLATAWPNGLVPGFAASALAIVAISLVARRRPACASPPP
ncbi:MAG: sodium/proline symporter [Planctomycetes bacterium]|nr:sodium/proline symporter [Planctomycetota bacterium]